MSPSTGAEPAVVADGGLITGRTLRRSRRIAWRVIKKEYVDGRVRFAALARRVWRAGPAERISVLLLLALVSIVAFASLLPSSQPVAHALRTAGGLGLFVLAWSSSLAVLAIRRRPWLLLLASGWLIFYAGILSIAWVRTPIAVLPSMWLACTLLLLLRGHESAGRGLFLWLAAAGGLAYVMAGPSGLRSSLGWEPAAARLLLWGVLAAAGLAAFVWGQRVLPERITYGWTLTGGLTAAGAAIALSAWKNFAGTGEAMQLVFSDAAAIVVLFWLWTAGAAAAGGVKFTERTLRHAARLLPPALVILSAPVLIVAAILAAAFGPPALGPLALAVRQAGIWAGIAALGLLLWWTIAGRITAARASLVFAWWLMALLALNGLVAAAIAIIDAHASKQAIVGLSLLAVAFGLARELSGMTKDWSMAPVQKVRTCVVLVTVTVSCAVVVSTLPGNAWETTRALMALLGMLHVGLPLALYETWGRRARTRLMGTGDRIVIFAAGYAAAMIVIAIEPARTVALLLALPILLAVLAMLKRLRRSLTAVSGACAGVLFVSGLIAGWMHPNPPTIPYLPFRILAAGIVVDKPLLSGYHIALLAGAWVMGIALGWMVFRASGSGHREHGTRGIE